MLVDFNTLSDDSRIWIYASDQKFSKDQENYILHHVSDHLRNWVAHTAPLKAGVTVLENHFIVVALDEKKNSASGCSIDTLQNRIIEIERELSLSLMNRSIIFCSIDDTIRCIPLNRLEYNANKDTLFYDLTIQKKSELSNWLKEIKDGWCNSFLK
jgi:hypothetical protein